MVYHPTKLGCSSHYNFCNSKHDLIKELICFNDSGENRKWRLTKWNLLHTSSINNQLKLRFLIIHSFWDRANFAWSKLLEIFEISPEVESVCCLYSAYATYVIFYAEMIIPCKKKKKKKEMKKDNIFEYFLWRPEVMTTHTKQFKHVYIYRY